MDEKELQLLFNSISSRFDVGDFNAFKTKMQTPEQRKSFYNVIGSKGIDIGGYDDYETRLAGVKKNGSLWGAESQNLISNGKLQSGGAQSPSTPRLGSGNGSPLLSEELKKVGGKLINPIHEKQPFAIDGNDPVKSFLTPYYESQNKAAERLNKPVSESTGQRFLSAPSQLQEDIASKNTHDFATETGKALNAKDIVSQSLFPSGKDAKDYMTRKIVSKGTLDPENETDNLAIERKNEYDNLYKNITDAKSIRGAALINEINTDENFKKQFEALHNEGLNLPREMEGALTADFMYKNRNNLEDLVKEHPELKDDYEDLKKNFLNIFPETGQAIVANKISQAREKAGYNSSVANFHTKLFDKHNDQIAKGLTPEEQKVWNEHKDEITKMVDTGGFVNRFEEAVEGGWSSTKGLFNRVSGLNSKGERISDELAKQSMAVNNGETGWKKNLGTAGNFAGVITYMMAGGQLGQGLGLGATAAEAVSNVATFGEDQFKNGEMKYPDNPFKATLNGIANTVMFAALSPLKTGQLTKAMDGIFPKVDEAIAKLPESATANAAKKTISDAVFDGLKQYGVSVGEMGVIIPAFSQGMDMAMGLDKQTFDKYHHGEFERSIKDMAIGGLLPAIGRFGLEAMKAGRGTQPHIIEQEKPAEEIPQPTKTEESTLPDEQKIKNAAPLTETPPTEQTGEGGKSSVSSGDAPALGSVEGKKVGGIPKAIDEKSITDSQNWINNLFALPDYSRIKDKDGNVYQVANNKLKKLTLDENGKVIDSEQIYNNRRKEDGSYRNSQSSPDFFRDGYEVIPEQKPESLLPNKQTQGEAAQPKVTQLESQRDMDILREKAKVEELDFVKDEDLPTEEREILGTKGKKKGKVIGTENVPKEELINKQKIISDKFKKLKEFLGCLTKL